MMLGQRGAKAVAPSFAPSRGSDEKLQNQLNMAYFKPSAKGDCSDRSDEQFYEGVEQMTPSLKGDDVLQSERRRIAEPHYFVANQYSQMPRGGMDEIEDFETQLETQNQAQTEGIFDDQMDPEADQDQYQEGEEEEDFMDFGPTSPDYMRMLQQQ